MKKAYIIELCKRIAEDYDGWEYTAGMFKSKQLKHSTITMNPCWSFSSLRALSQPLTLVLNKTIDELEKKILSNPAGYTSGVFHQNAMRIAERKDKELVRLFRSEKRTLYPDYMRSREIRDEHLESGEAEARIRLDMDICMEIVEKRYSYASDEQTFLEQLPLEIEGILGFQYCLVRAYLGDFQYVLDYRADKIETICPKRHDEVDKVIEYFDIKG